MSNKLTGFPNLGNTCFISAAIQGILSCNELIDEIIKSNTKYSEIFQNIHTERIKSISSIIMLYIKLNPDYQFGSSQDASEFLMFILDDLNEKAIDEKIKLDPELKRNDTIGISSYQINYENNIYYIKKDEESKINCKENILFLEIKSTIIESLVNYLIEKPEEENPENEKIFRKIITKMGSVMILSLVRFKKIIVNDKIHYIKNDEDVIITNEINMKDNNVDIPMILNAFIVHIGSTTGGHYICYRKFENKWYCIDDETVIEVENPNMKKAYILFYVKT